MRRIRNGRGRTLGRAGGAMLALCLLALASSPAPAATFDLTFGGAYATSSQATSTTDEQYVGAGSWFKTTPVSPVVELYIDPATQLGGTFNIQDIQRITYHTLNDATNPSDVDFFLKIYTHPYTGGDAGWYGNRLNAEPLYSNSYSPPAAGVWNNWTTDVGTNQLVFFDSNHTLNFGFYNGPTLQDIVAGPIDWNVWDPGSAPSSIDYASQPVLYLVLGTGSGWPSFTGYLDGISIELTNGDIYDIDLEDFVSDVYVDDDWVGTAPGVEVEPGNFFGYNAFDTIQGGVDNVFGSTVNVAAGTYEEQVIVDGKDVEIIGSGAGVTFIHSPATLTTAFTTSAANKPVVAAMNTGNVVIRDLTIDGLGRGNANARFYGVAFWEAGGALLDCVLTGIRETPFSGAQHGVALYAYNSSGGPFALEVGGCTIVDFQKNAMALSGAGLTVDVHDCDVTGAGDTAVTAQNGIQVGYGAGGSIADCTISAIRYTPATWVASGVLTWGPGIPLVTSGTITITDTQAPVSWYDTNGTAGGFDITGGDFDGIFVYNTSATAKAGPSDRPVAAPYVDVGGMPANKRAGYAVTVTNSCLAGSDTPLTDGIGVYSEGGPLAVTVTQCTIADYDVGLVLFGAVSTLTANDNSITSNLTAGYDASASGLAQDASYNWWGAADGPSGDGSGTGDAVLSVGGEVAFAPWRIDGTSSVPCGFVQANNLVEPDPDPDDCVSGPTPCITVPFNLTRSDGDNLRGYSVTFQLSPELQLCGTMAASIREGTYLGAIGGTTFQLIDNTGGSYTVDNSILGLPCGATAPTGFLFEVDVMASGGDGVGTITVTSVRMRDCVNAPIPADAGGTATLPVDFTPVSGMTSLAASQVKSGNDTDGTTQVVVTWTAPGGDAATVELYRKGFGSYPEYDDAGGIVPTPPATPGAGGWVFAASVPAAAGTHTDEVATRDFWYYTAFVVDDCDNVGPVSNMTSGTLNYHLGDVSNGTTPGVGDNDVFLEDISLLGSNYGNSLIPGDPVNYLDVGPTTDFSVDALPTTDNQVQFEDLMMFAINYNQVGKRFAAPDPANRNEILVAAPAHVIAGELFEVTLTMAGDGSIQGLSIPLTWNSSVVEPVSYRPGTLLESQGGRSLLLSPKPGTVDAALFGLRIGISGEEVLAYVSFRAKDGGDPAVGLGRITARNGENQPEPVNGTVSEERPATLPSFSTLARPVPNPFNPRTRIEFAVGAPGPVQVKIYSLDGRLVRTLVNEFRDVGVYSKQWSGIDDGGQRVASGTYIVRMVASDRTQSHSVTLLK